MIKSDFQKQLIFFCGLGVLISCNKNKTTTATEPVPVTTGITSGLPSDPRKINGYFYASNRTSISNGSGTYYNYYMSQYATFGDPVRNLIPNYNHLMDNTQFNGSNSNSGNVNVGNILFNGNQLNSSSGSATYGYSNVNVNVLNYSAHWDTHGNGSFKPLGLSIPRGFPNVSKPASINSYTMSLANDFTIDFSGFISNFDSLCVGINAYVGTSDMVKKSIASGASSITFTKAELSSLYTTTYGNIRFRAYNYSNITEEDKIYVFELANKLDMQLVIIP